MEADASERPPRPSRRCSVSRAGRWCVLACGRLSRRLGSGEHLEASGFPLREDMKKIRLRTAFLVLGSVMAVDRVSYAQVAPPTIEKAFGAPSIPLDGATTLTFTLSNPNPAVTLTGIGMSDTLPAGLVITNPCGLSGSCNGTFTAACSSSSISLVGATLAPNASCFVTVNSIMGTTTQGGSGSAAMASITVETPAPPTIEKAFGAPSIPLDGATTLTFTLSNPNPAVTLTGIGMSDTLPAGLVITNPCGLSGSCNGTFTAACSSSSNSLVGATLAPNASCFVTVNSIMGTTVGVKDNVTSAVTSTQGGSGSAAMARIGVGATPTPTSTPTSTPTNTPTPTPTNTATSTPTGTPTNTPTATSTSTPTATSTPTSTPTSVPPTATQTPAPAPPPPTVPTLSFPMLALLALVLAGAALLMIRRP